MNVTPDDIDELVSFIDLLLLSVGFSALVIGALLGWYLRGRYESWYWLKYGPPSIDLGKGDGQ